MAITQPHNLLFKSGICFRFTNHRLAGFISGRSNKDCTRVSQSTTGDIVVSCMWVDNPGIGEIHNPLLKKV
jgi:hypothetical protein